MHNTTITATRLLALTLALSALVACKRDDAAVVTSDTGMTASVPTPAAVLSVDGIETGKGVNADKSIMDDAHDFGVRDTVWVSVKTEGKGSGTLAAKFTFQDGQTINEASQQISPTGDAHHEFHVQKATPWPKGDYKVEVMLNGASAGTKDFTVK